MIGVAGKGERREARGRGVDAKLLAELADERCLRRLAGFDLAAGELPEAGHGFSGRTLSDQHAAVRVDERTGGDEQ